MPVIGLEPQPFAGWMKGVPASPVALSAQQIADMRLNLLSEKIALPCAIIKESALRCNETWMSEFARKAGVQLCPHGKTTMSPELFSRQLQGGAWGITAATFHQLKVMRACGVPRILYANQMVDALSIQYVVAELNRDPGFDFYCLVDSLTGVEILRRCTVGVKRPLKVLLELGQKGARTGVRDAGAALSVALAVQRVPTLSLAGVETYEFVVSGKDDDEREANMRRLFDDFKALTAELDREGLFGTPEIVLTAGGSAYFDLAAEALTTSHLSRPIVPVIRSGCYLTHDQGWLPASLQRMRSRSRLVAGIEGTPRGAIEIWAHIQSRPEPQRALATFGKRDVSFDIRMPEPVLWYRSGVHAHPLPIEDGTRVTGLNDQHAYLDLPADSPLQEGDMIGVGISHPCTTFDKWRSMLIVEDDYSVIGAISTYF